MCSRFENKESGLSIFKKLSKNSGGEFILEEFEDIKHENIAPTDRIIVILKDEGKFKITDAKWGIKFNDDKSSPLIFNSRIETVREKAYWRNLFKNNRCLVPATAFYEWKSVGNKKIPHKITIENNQLFYFSSIYTLINKKLMVSIITTGPNLFMRNIHKRMPHINEEENILLFLNNKNDGLVNDVKPLNNNVQMNIDVL